MKLLSYLSPDSSSKDIAQYHRQLQRGKCKYVKKHRLSVASVKPSGSSSGLKGWVIMEGAQRGCSKHICHETVDSYRGTLVRRPGLSAQKSHSGEVK